MSVFGFSDYREYLRDWLSSQERGSSSRLCEAMECQPAHLSRVIQDKVQLTMDQAFLASQFLNLSRAEQTYFLKLTERDRAGNARYRRQLSDELTELRRAQEDLSKRFKQSSLGDQQTELVYYSSWHWIAIHYITASPSFQTPARIADRLGLSVAFVKSSLETLEGFGLVARRGDRWILASGSIHMPRTSPLNSVQHGNWRTRAVLHSQDPQDDGVHYTMVQTISEADFSKLKQQLLKAIDHYRSISDASASEELVCFTLDFFRA